MARRPTCPAPSAAMASGIGLDRPRPHGGIRRALAHRSARTPSSIPAPSGAACSPSCRRAAKPRWRMRSAPRSACGPTIRTCRSRRCPAATSRRSSSAAGSRTGRKLLIAEDPTAGVDVGAKAEIYRLIAQRARGRPRRRRGLHRLRGGRPYLPPRPGLLARADRRAN